MSKALASFLLASVSFATVSLAAAGCDSPPEDLREWTVEDHKHRTERASGRRERASKHARPQRSDQVAGVTWINQCASCHGRKGKGDGPASAMVQAKDLTSQEWQSSVTDEQLAQSILKGKGKMPAFNLPERTVEGLVKHVRSLRRRSRAERLAKARGAQGKPSTAMPAGQDSESSEEEAAEDDGGDEPKSGGKLTR